MNTVLVGLAFDVEHLGDHDSTVALVYCLRTHETVLTHGSAAARGTLAGAGPMKRGESTRGSRRGASRFENTLGFLDARSLELTSQRRRADTHRYDFEDLACKNSCHFIARPDSCRKTGTIIRWACSTPRRFASSRVTSTSRRASSSASGKTASKDALIDQLEEWGMPFEEIFAVEFSQSRDEMEARLKQLGRI